MTKVRPSTGEIEEIDMDPARVQVATTGQPMVKLLACTQCGVLLWDIDAHYGHAHPEPSDYDVHCPTCDAPEPTHTPTCAVVNVQVPEPSDP